MATSHQFFVLASLFLLFFIKSATQSTSSEQQKTAGVPGIPGSPGRNGVQGRDGRDGRDGEKGGIGMKGDKGDRGVAGLIGREGDEGMKGEKGDAGPVGPKGGSGKRGPEGPKGLTGTRGEKGNKGMQGHSVRVQDVHKTVHSVVQTVVDDKLKELNSTFLSKIEQLEQSVLDEPVAHLSGDNTGHGVYSSGYVVNQWYSSSGSVWSPYLRGGMQYSNGYITVPQHGLYYVYAQMYYYHRSSSYRQAGYYVNVNGSYRGQAYRYTQHSGDYHSHYTGRIISLDKGDRLSLSFSNTCYYYFYNRLSFFGAFKVS